MNRPRGVQDEFFHFYYGVIEDFKVQIPFINFAPYLLKTLNVAPSQLCPNSWGFVKDFEMVCEVVDIIPHNKLILFFFEVKGVGKRRWISLNGIPGKCFLQVYTTNYKGFKDKFLRVKGGDKCPRLMFVLGDVIPQI